jgi:hypothetical protein
METGDVIVTGAGAKSAANPSDLTLTSVARDEADRNPIFDALVSSEGEVSGLVAYSIYKQNKREWLEDFKKLTGRLPTDAETRSYIIGESTARRLAIYRQLAQTTLSEQGVRVSASSSAKPGSPIAAAIWALAIVIALAAIGYGLRSAGVIGPK